MKVLVLGSASGDVGETCEKERISWGAKAVEEFCCCPLANGSFEVRINEWEFLQVEFQKPRCANVETVECTS